MNPTLSQKHPIKGSREFTLLEDEVQYTIKSPFKEESLSVVFNVLDSEPVIEGSTLSFVSQVNREPLVDFFLDKPDKESFDTFIKDMQSRIADEDFSLLRVRDKGVDVDVERLTESIEMLEKYVDTTEIASLLTAMRALQAQPEDLACLSKVADTFNALGFVQGQVLTYSPYINFLLSGERSR